MMTAPPLDTAARAAVSAVALAAPDAAGDMPYCGEAALTSVANLAASAAFVADASSFTKPAVAASAVPMTAVCTASARLRAYAASEAATTERAAAVCTSPRSDSMLLFSSSSQSGWPRVGRP
jgi:hypothetical protein